MFALSRLLLVQPVRWPATAMQPLLWGFGIPFLVLVGVLFAALQLSGSEGVAALSALAALVPYYGLLWVFREKMREQLAFSIEQ